MEITVRKATESDAMHLYELNREFNGENAATEASIADSLANNINEIVLIALIGNEAIGFLCGQISRSMCYKSAHGEVGELFVSEEYRRTGAGRALITHMEDIFRKNNALVVTLATSLQNVTAQVFYENCGYTRKDKCTYRKNL